MLELMICCICDYFNNESSIALKFGFGSLAVNWPISVEKRTVVSKMHSNEVILFFLY